MDQKTSSVTETHPHTRTPLEQFKMPTWAILIVLVLIMIGLKSFVYIKDGKRDGR